MGSGGCGPLRVRVRVERLVKPKVVQEREDRCRLKEKSRAELSSREQSIQAGQGREVTIYRVSRTVRKQGRDSFFHCSVHMELPDTGRRG
jgi:hypothetical protein